ncbi:MAG: hypothetical protein GTN90_02860 [Xanthomonadales bacterium]|nr:hypothetical protein [Xanthomonadales bacterium]
MVLGAGQMVAEDDTTADPGFDELAASARLRASAASVIAEFEATEPESREDTDDSPGSDEIRAFLAAVNAGVSGQGAEDEADAPVGGVGATTDEPPAGTDAVPEADPAVTAEIEPPEEAETPEPGAAHQGFDPDSMKAMIREVLQAELQGETGRNLSRNIQILVRNEIDTALKRKK